VTAPGEQPSPIGDEAASGKRVYSGEVNTLVELYSRHERRIYRYCLSLLRNPDDAEDATQETFTRAAPFLPNLAGDLSAYLTTVARNICCDVVRSRARRNVSIEKVPVPDRAVSPERQSVDWDVVRRMWRQLSPNERLLFAYTFAGYRYEEIATRTGMSRPSVSVGLARARRRLRDLATAIGALGLLPVGIRRLLDRIARRTNLALTTGQETLLGVAQQIGTVAVSLLAGLTVLAGAGSQAAGPLPMMATAFHERGGPAAPSPTRVAAAAPLGTAGSVARDAGSTRGAAPSPTPAPTPLLKTATGTLPWVDATPADASVYSMTASPDYQRDNTVFVSGRLQTGCLCDTLFRSSDAGHSWSQVGPGTFHGGKVLLSPRFPADPAVFAINPGVALQRSPDGTGPFTDVVPTALAAAIAPDSTPGHTRLAVALSGTLLTYNADTGAPMPGPPLPAGFQAQGLAFAGPNSVVLTGAAPAATTALQAPAVVTCSLVGTCGLPAQLTDPGPGTAISLAAPVTGWGPLVISTATRAYLSRDGGSSFAPVLAAPAGEHITATGIAGTLASHRLAVALADPGHPGHTAVVYSDDLGKTFTDATGNLDTNDMVIGLDILPDASLLAGISADLTHLFALRTSTGNGTWAAPKPS
jgi:RNA polymerase sigma factor (sigma-70 family)